MQTGKQMREKKQTSNDKEDFNDIFSPLLPHMRKF